MLFRSPVILITAFADIPMVVTAMRGGAVAFLEKTCSQHELWESIRNALGLDVKRRAALQRHRELRERLNALTPDERQVLGCILEGKANKVIASRLQMGLRTVEARRANIFSKMQVDSLAALVRQIIRDHEEADLHGRPAETRIN